ATGCLQQRRQLSFNKAMLFIRIADVSEWRTHIKRSACLALKQNVIAAKMDLSRVPCGRSLFEVSAARLILSMLFVADGLCVLNLLGYWRSWTGSRGLISRGCVCRYHDFGLLTQGDGWLATLESLLWTLKNVNH